MLRSSAHRVFGQRVGHTERAHFAGDCDAGGGRENRSSEKQAELRGCGDPEPPGHLHAHLRDSGVQLFLLRPGASIPLHVRPDMNGIYGAPDPHAASTSSWPGASADTELKLLLIH